MRDVDADLVARFGDSGVAPDIAVPDVWKTLARRGCVRSFRPDAVSPELVKRLSLLALCAPTKSDLQQRDFIHVTEPSARTRILSLIADQPWTQDIPELLIVCANNARQRQIHEMRGHPFANDHLDAMFNAAVDAGVALSAFVIAAEAAGLGCCPISAVRNHAEEISGILQLPRFAFPVAGLALGWPSEPPRISPRLAHEATVHADTLTHDNTTAVIDAYDSRRNETAPYATQRNVERFGINESYGWSEDKARQYAEPERADFATFLRNQGFKLD